MRGFAAALLVLGGCYGYGNPYDTSDLQDALEDKTHEIWELELIRTYEFPQFEKHRLADPDLEAWRDTVLATADDATLERLRSESRRKIGSIESRCADLLRLDEHNREPKLTAEVWALRVEKIKLSMIEARIETGAPRRTD